MYVWGDRCAVEGKGANIRFDIGVDNLGIKKRGLNSGMVR